MMVFAISLQRSPYVNPHALRVAPIPYCPGPKLPYAETKTTSRTRNNLYIFLISFIYFNRTIGSREYQRTQPLPLRYTSTMSKTYTLPKVRLTDAVFLAAIPPFSYLLLWLYYQPQFEHYNVPIGLFRPNSMHALLLAAGLSVAFALAYVLAQ